MLDLEQLQERASLITASKQHIGENAMITRNYLQDRLDFYTTKNDKGEIICKDSYSPESQTRILSKSIKLKIISYYLEHSVWVYNCYSTSLTPNSLDPRFLKAEKLTND